MHKRNKYREYEKFEIKHLAQENNESTYGKKKVRFLTSGLETFSIYKELQPDGSLALWFSLGVQNYILSKIKSLSGKNLPHFIIGRRGVPISPFFDSFRTIIYVPETKISHLDSVRLRNSYGRLPREIRTTYNSIGRTHLMNKYEQL